VGVLVEFVFDVMFLYCLVVWDDVFDVVGE